VDHTESAEVVELIGSVEGRTALIVDDFTISAGTLADAARVLVERGAASVYAAVTHGLLTGPAIERLDASPIEKLFMTDSVETQPVEFPPRLRWYPSPVCSLRRFAGSRGERAFPFSSAKDCRPHAATRRLFRKPPAHGLSARALSAPVTIASWNTNGRPSNWDYVDVLKKKPFGIQAFVLQEAKPPAPD
jgi:hypothetical protein